jgi:hypothetical protein
MQRDDGDWIKTTPQTDGRLEASKRLFTWIFYILILLALLNIASVRLLPAEAGAIASTILSDAMVVISVGALPILAVLLWNLLRLTRQSFWGLSILIVGLGVLLPGSAVYEVITTFWGKPSQSSLIATAALVVIWGGVAIISFGMLVIFAWAMWKGAHMLLGRQQTRLGDER